MLDHAQISFAQKISIILVEILVQVVASSGDRPLSQDLVRRAVNEALTATAALHPDLVVHGAQEK